jgi:hypothetical protein
MIMSVIAQQVVTLLDRLSEINQVALLKYAEFLAVDDEEDMDFCVALYDEGMAEDDGTSISSEELRAQYGL